MPTTRSLSGRWLPATLIVNTGEKKAFQDLEATASSTGGGRWLVCMRYAMAGGRVRDRAAAQLERRWNRPGRRPQPRTNHGTG
jgi:hypothetical protein